jgi:protein-S-isoprenylcysteine O-methyltransferase Ste14
LYLYPFLAMWMSWGIYWWISSRTVKPTARKESISSRLSYIGPLVLAVYLLLVHDIPIAVLRTQVVPQAPWSFAVAATITGAGLLLAVWARRHIGANWSGTVTIKEGHQLIITGPYAMVRHPIYAGLLLAMAGSAMAVGEWRSVLAVALALLSFVHKLRLEERWMHQQFGEVYRAYSQRTAALVPFIW